MRRRSVGPVQLNGGVTWYVRLWVPRPLRQKAGKTTLIRSLKNTNHGIALRRHGAAYAALEKELQALLKGETFRTKVELSAEDTALTTALSPREQAELALGAQLDPANPLHAHVYAFYDKQTPLPVSWDEAVELWIEVRNRENTRPQSPGSIKKVKCNIEDFKPYSEPLDITIDILDKFVNDQEKLITPLTVKSKLKGISTFIALLVSKRKIDRNVLKDYTYKVGNNSKKRSYTDEEFRLVAEKEPACYWMAMTGMRIAEYQHGSIEDNIIVVAEADDNEFRPKTLSSYRRVPLPQGFTRPSTKPNTSREHLRKLIPDKNVTPH